MTKRICATAIFFCSITCLIILVNPISILADSGLPPRPYPIQDKDDDDGGRVGGTIVLQAYPEWIGAWTVVQWQDSANQWHTVEGWQGDLQLDSRKEWWVAPKDFATGPFRWLVLARKGGELITMSDSFYLPSSDRQTVTVQAPYPETSP